MRNKTSIMVLLGGLVLGGNAWAQGAPAATPAMLANACAGCHGTNGVSVGPSSPTIAGISTEYFVTVMTAYKKAEWPSTIMTRIAKGYSDDEIKAMAEFFAKQKYVAAPNQKADAAKAKAGEKLHKEFCDKCHEKGGASSDDGGILAGQWMPYLTFALEDYESGKRPQPPKMKKEFDVVVQNHKKEGLEALVHFYGSAK
ncbi:MAG: cytochrome c4 [Alphaproteobacteria bacterium]